MIILRSNFSVVSGLTVEDGYNWDRGLPTSFKPLLPLTADRAVYGSAPFTKVRFKILSDVIPKYRLETWFTFNADDYYSETKSITAFNPREPFHPDEDRYGVVWSWHALATKPSSLRSTLTWYFSSAYDAIKTYDSLDDTQDIFAYPEKVVRVLSAVPPKGALLLKPSLSANLLQYNATTNTIEYNTARFNPVLYERWSPRYSQSPNLLATFETLRASSPNSIPSFNRNIYVSGGIIQDGTLGSQNRNPEYVETLSSCYQPFKIIDYPLQPTNETAKTLSVAHATWNLPWEEFNSSTYLVRNGQPALLATQTPVSPVSLTPVRNLRADNYTPFDFNKIRDPYRIAPVLETIGQPVKPTLWVHNNVQVTNYAGFAPTSTASLSSRVAVNIRPLESIEDVVYSISQNILNESRITGGININWLSPTVGLSSLTENFVIGGRPSYTGMIGNSSVRLSWNTTDTRWELFNITANTIACTGNSDNLFSSIWTSVDGTPPLIENVASVIPTGITYSPITDFQNKTVIASIFVKALKNITKVRLNLGGPCLSGAPCFTDWDLEAGILLKRTGNISNYQIQSVGDGWFHLSMTTTILQNGSCTYSFIILKKEEYTLNVALSSKFVAYRLSTYENDVLIYEPQFLIRDNNTPTPLIPVQSGSRDHVGKVHRLSWFYTPHETSTHYFWVGSDNDAVLLHGEADKEEDMQNYPFDYLICRNYPAYGDAIYPENQTHWDRSALQLKSLKLEKNKTYYFEARWWQQQIQSYIDIGWTTTNPSWEKKQWYEASQYFDFQKLWLREGYTADAEIEHVYTVPQTYTPVLTVNVTNPEIRSDYVYDDKDAFYDAVNLSDYRPTANFATLSTEYGYSPLTVEFSPRATKPGAFPIEKIDWDFGDGSPIVTVSRYTTLSSSENVIYRPIPTAVDKNDPRNFNIRHTYNRYTPADPRIFYPSITAYSSVTDIYDSCSREIGPVALRGKFKKDIIKTSFYGTQNSGTFVLDLQGQAAVLRKENNYTKNLTTAQPLVTSAPPNRIVYYNDLGTNVATNSGIGFKELIEI